MPEAPSSIEKQALQAKELLKAGDIKKEDIDKISALLANQEVIDAIKKTIDQNFATEVLKRFNQKGVLTEGDKSVMRLLAILHPELTLNTRLEQTDKPSGKISALLNGGGNALNFEEFKKLKPEQIQEIFRTLNKGDLLALSRAIPEKKPDNIDQTTFDTLKSTITSTVAIMLQNAMSIENVEDIAFLEKYGSPEAKKAIESSKNDANGILKDYKGNPKVSILQKGGIIELKPITDSRGKIESSIDISKLNTVDLKTSAEQITRQMGTGFDKAKFAESINSLLKSDNKIMRGLGELMKIFGALLGIDFGEKKEASEKPLDAKQRRELLVKMKKNDSYTLGSFFDVAGNMVGKNDDPKFQLYLGDIDKILGPNFVKKSDDKKSFIYDDSVGKRIADLEKSLKIEPQSGKLDIVTIDKILSKLDTDGKPIVETPQAGVAPAAPSEPARTAPEIPKNKYSNLYDGLKGKATFEAIKSDPVARKLIQESLGVTEDIYGPKTKAAVKEFQVRELGMQKVNSRIENFADGFFGPKTLTLLKAKIDKEMPAPKK